MVMDVEELGRRAVACKGWRWMSGMLTLPGSYSGRQGRPAERLRRTGDVPVLGGGVWSIDWGAGFISDPLDCEPLPDLADPATLGCLLALVREAWGCEVWLSPEWNDAERWWMVRRATNDVGCGPGGRTPAEALVRALEAAP